MAEAEYRCFVGGLTWTTDDRSLEKVFSQFGDVVDSKVRHLATKIYLSTWECGGYFVYNKTYEFAAEIFERLAAASLDDYGFQALKQLRYNIVVKLHHDLVHI